MYVVVDAEVAEVELVVALLRLVAVVVEAPTRRSGSVNDILLSFSIFL